MVTLKIGVAEDRITACIIKLYNIEDFTWWIDFYLKKTEEFFNDEIISLNHINIKSLYDEAIFIY